MAKRTARSEGALIVRSTRGVSAARGGDPLVDEAIVEIRRIWTTGLRDTVVRLGNYLIQTFYGNLEAARSMAPVKEASLAELLARADELPVSAHALKSAVRVALVVRELPRATAAALSASHHELLAAVRDRDTRQLLADEAVSKQLSVRELKSRVLKEQPRHAGGRNPQHPLERGVAAVVRALAAQEIADGLAPSRLRLLSRDQVEQLDIKARRARELLEQIQDALSRQLRK